MNNRDHIAMARSLPQGAVFHRCALQVNPHGYAETFRGQSAGMDAASHALALVEKAHDLGITVLAITNHNDVHGVPAFRAAAEGGGIHVFPGFELGSSEGVHLLCLYPLDTSDEELSRYLGEFGIRRSGPSSELSSRALTDVLRCVREQGGIAIAAHATSEQGGLFKVLRGQARIQAWRSEDLLAVQIPGQVDDLPSEIRQIVENQNAEYHRNHSPGERLAIALVNAKDIVNPSDLTDPSATCWIKMSEISIEGLRQAFLDPRSRIRLQGSLDVEQHSELVALAWEGGFLDGVGIHLNPNLNVLVGGRGSGKSTIVESIRSVLGLEPIGEDARKAHDGIIRHVLRGGTKISLLVRVHRPAVREYRIERTVPNPPLVRDDNGDVSNLTPRDILSRIEVYGQHEISELSKSSEMLTRLLDRFVERDDSLDRRKASLRRELEKTRIALLDTRNEIEQIRERLAALPGLEETLKRFQEAGVEDKLREQSLLVREERVLDGIPARIAPFREVLETLRREVPIDRVFLSEKALAELPGRAILMQATEMLADLERAVVDMSEQMEKALDRAERGIAGVRSRWTFRKQEVQAAYEKILRELQKSRVDGEEFIRLRRRIEELRPLQERLALLQRLDSEHADRRRALLAEWEDVKAEEFRALDRAAKKVSRSLQNRVQVDVTAAGNREALFNVLREDIGGRMAETIDSLRAVPDVSLTQFVEACRSGAEVLSRTYRITPAQAERLARAEPEVLMRIEELELTPTTSIQLNTAPGGEPPVWQMLEDLSTGQKATAVLLLLLLESDAPLIVDQPEDDLDNRFITEGVVPRMREEKQRRQFVFSTHNANIPVLGDAELILGLSPAGEANGGHARILREHMGSIDLPSVRDLVEEILEGGREAFEMRRRKYGF